MAEDDKLLSWRSLVSERTPENDAERKRVADSMWPYQENKAGAYVLNKGEYLTIGNFTQNSYGKSLRDSFVYGQSGSMVEMVALQALFEAATGKKVDVMYIMTHLRSALKKVASKSFIDHKDVIDGSTDGALWINREMYDQRYQYDQYPHEIYKVDITQNEFRNMMQSLNGNNYYSMLNHNCSSVASKVWNETVGYKADSNGYYFTDKTGKRIKTDLFINARGKGILSILDFPGAVCESIQGLKNKGTSRGKYYSENSKIVKGTIFSIMDGGNGGSLVPGTPEQSGPLGDKSDKDEVSDAGTGNSLTGNSSAGTSLAGGSSVAAGASASGTQNADKKEEGGIINGVFSFIGSIFSFVFGW